METQAQARPFWKNPWFIAGVTGILTLTVLQALQSRTLHALPELGAVPEFELTDASGAVFSTDDLKDRVAIVSFFFTSCSTTCPAIMQAMKQVQTAVASSSAAARIHLVSVSVDPEYDTPAVMTAYAKKANFDLTRWHLLTGTRPAIESFVVQGFRTAMGEKAPSNKGLIDIAHSMKLVLVDRNGQIRHYFGTEPKDLELLAAYALEYANAEVAR